MPKIDSIIERSKSMRAQYFHPLLKGLDKIGLTANRLTFIRFIGGIIFILAFPFFPKEATIFLLVVAVIDMFDGALARYQHKESDRGKFWDVLVDHINYVLAIWAISMAGVASDVLVEYHLVVVPVLFLLAIIYVGETMKTDWIIYPYHRLIYFKPLGILALFLWVFAQINIFDPLLWVLNVSMTLMALSYAYKIQCRWKHESKDKLHR